MIPARTYFLSLSMLVVLCFGVATILEPQFQAWRGSRVDGDVFKVVLGESRVLFANQFYVKADEYYHSGYYPGIFDNQSAFATPHMAADTGAIKSDNHGAEGSFRGPPIDWLEKFGRHFFPNRHTHLDEGGAENDLSDSSEIAEILPWLKLSIDLDPHNVDTYVVTAYWLRSRMGNANQAGQVLREGLRNNPKNPEILFELGRLYSENHHDGSRARNVWEAAAHYWQQQSVAGTNVDASIYEKITTCLADLEKKDGNVSAAITWFKEAKSVSLTPEALQKQIDELKAGQTNAPAVAPR